MFLFKCNTKTFSRNKTQPHATQLFFNIATQEGQSQDPPARRQRSANCARLKLLTERVHRALETPKPGRQLLKKPYLGPLNENKQDL